MADQTPFGGQNPNSQHQLWSRWTFFVADGPRHPPTADVRYNFAKWARMQFGSAGRARVDHWRTIPVAFRALALTEGVALTRRRHGFSMICEVEGKPAHDVPYRDAVWHSFETFVFRGWGPGTYRRLAVKILAGDQQDGRPADQLLVIPSLTLAPEEEHRG